MKSMTKTASVLGFTLAMAVTTALSQPFPNSTWTIDENGPAILTSPSGLVGFSNPILQVEPISGLVGLYYPLGGTPSVPGDLLLFEPQAPTGQFSDLLRFDGRGGVYFFSELEPGEPKPDLADVPVMPTPGANAITVLEVGPEGNNGYLYIPLAGQPGADTSGVLPGIQYNILSDVVPEPSSVALALAGAGLLALRTIRHYRRA